MNTVRPLLFFGLGDCGCSIAEQVFKELLDNKDNPIGQLSVGIGCNSKGELVDFRSPQSTQQIFTGLESNYRPNVFKDNHQIIKEDSEYKDLINNHISTILTEYTFGENKIKVSDRFNTQISEVINWVIFAPLFDPVGSSMLLPILDLYSESKDDPRTGQLDTFLLFPSLYYEEQLFERDSNAAKLCADARTYALLSELEYLLSNEGKIGNQYHMRKLTVGNPKFWVVNNKSQSFNITSTKPLVQPIKNFLELLNWQYKLSDVSFLGFHSDRHFNTIGYFEVSLNKGETRLMLESFFEKAIIEEYYKCETVNTNSISTEHAALELLNLKEFRNWSKLLAITPDGANIYRGEYDFVYVIEDKVFEDTHKLLETIRTSFEKHVFDNVKPLEKQLSFERFKIEQKFILSLRSKLKTLFENYSMKTKWYSEFFGFLLNHNESIQNLRKIREEIYSEHDEWFEASDLQKILWNINERLSDITAQRDVLGEKIQETRDERKFEQTHGVERTEVVIQRDNLTGQITALQSELSELNSKRFNIDTTLDSPKLRRKLFDDRNDHILVDANKLESEIQVETEGLLYSMHEKEEIVEWRNHLVRQWFLLVPLLLLCLGSFVTLVLIFGLKWISLATMDFVKYTGIITIGYYILLALIFSTKVEPKKRTAENKYKLSYEKVHDKIRDYVNLFKLQNANEILFYHWSSSISWINELIKKTETQFERVRSFKSFLDSELEQSAKITENSGSHYTPDNMVNEIVASESETEYILEKHRVRYGSTVKVFLREHSIYNIYELFEMGDLKSCQEFVDAIREHVNDCFSEYFNGSIAKYFIEMDKKRLEERWKIKLKRRICKPEMFLQLIESGQSARPQIFTYLGIDSDSDNKNMLLRMIGADELINSPCFKPTSKDNIVVIAITSGFSSSNMAPTRQLFKSYIIEENNNGTSHTFALNEPLPSLLPEEKLTREHLKERMSEFRFFLIMRFLHIVKCVFPRHEEQVASDISKSRIHFELNLEQYGLKLIEFGRLPDEIWFGLMRLDDEAKSILSSLTMEKLEKYRQQGSTDKNISNRLESDPRFTPDERKEIINSVECIFGRTDSASKLTTWDHVMEVLEAK